MFVGGGGIASSSLKKNYVLVFLYSIPGVFCLSGGGGDNIIRHFVAYCI